MRRYEMSEGSSHTLFMHIIIQPKTEKHVLRSVMKATAVRLTDSEKNFFRLYVSLTLPMLSVGRTAYSISIQQFLVTRWKQNRKENAVYPFHTCIWFLPLFPTSISFLSFLWDGTQWTGNIEAVLQLQNMHFSHFLLFFLPFVFWHILRSPPSVCFTL